jgi:hypothetical protein
VGAPQPQTIRSARFSLSREGRLPDSRPSALMGYLGHPAHVSAEPHCPLELMEAILRQEEAAGHVERAGDGWRATPMLVERFGACAAV